MSAIIKRLRGVRDAVATSKLFEAVKKGEAWAICFFLKARHGWRDTPNPAGVNVNVGVGVGRPGAAGDLERVEERQRKLMKLMTRQEVLQYRDLMRRLAVRQQEEENRQRWQPARIETTATPASSNGSGSE